jgi:hypothetical protein
MNVAYPNTFKARTDDKLAHAFELPLETEPFLTLELIRADLFEYLDALTATVVPGADLQERFFEIDRTAQRLKEIMRLRPAALIELAQDGGREHLEELAALEPPPVGPKCLPIWKDALDQWKIIEALIEDVEAKKRSGASRRS